MKYHNSPSVMPVLLFIQASFLLITIGNGRSVAAEAAVGENVDTASLSRSMNAFACDLYHEFGQKPGNVFLSPGSIAIALSMTAAGARGETQAEMLRAMHVEQGDATVHEAYRRLLAEWNSAGAKGGFQLHLANRLWGQKGYRFVPRFLTLTRDKYGAELGIVDFLRHAEAARQEINAWVERQTAEKIKDLLPKDSVDRLTVLVLTNAVYFKSAWQSPFEKRATREEEFIVSAAEKAKTPMMRQTGFFGYAENDDVQILELPYAGGRLSMVVLLPRKVDGLRDLEKSLKSETLNQWLSRIRHRQVRVALPKFKLETPSLGLKPVLEKLGIRKAFGAADFSGISAQEDLFISEVYHKTFIDVYEEGTEAAAATAVVVVRSAPPPTKPPPVFRADHPFVFLIRDRQTGVILFLGRLVRP